jgi:hypothetical protein
VYEGELVLQPRRGLLLTHVPIGVHLPGLHTFQSHIGTLVFEYTWEKQPEIQPERNQICVSVSTPAHIAHA